MQRVIIWRTANGGRVTTGDRGLGLQRTAPKTSHAGHGGRDRFNSRIVETSPRTRSIDPRPTVVCNIIVQVSDGVCIRFLFFYERKCVGKTVKKRIHRVFHRDTQCSIYAFCCSTCGTYTSPPSIIRSQYARAAIFPSQAHDYGAKIIVENTLHAQIRTNICKRSARDKTMCTGKTK